MTEVLDALFGEKTEAPIETPPATPVESGPARDEGGRFASKPVEQPKAETPAVTPPAIEQPKAPEPPKQQPTEHGLSGPALAAVLDERDKRKKLEARLAELESRQQPEQIPSIDTDPQGYQRHLAEQYARFELNERFRGSEKWAAKEHGKEAVATAKEWGMQRAQSSPAFAAEYSGNEDPIDWIVRQHKEHEEASNLRDPDKRKAWIEAQARALGLIPNPATAAPAAQSQPAAPQSAKPDPFRQFDSAPSAGGPMTPVAVPNPIVERLFGKT